MDNYNTFNKIMIIGNGFDLAIGAKTSYNDFYNCLKDCFFSSSLDGFKNMYIYDDNEELINSFYEIVVKNKDNYFLNYFLNYNKIFGDWVSFETELTKIIKSFDNLISYLNSSKKLFLEMTYDTVNIYLRIIDDTELLQVLDVFKDNKYFCVETDIHRFHKKEGAVPFFIKGKYCKGLVETQKRIKDFSNMLPLSLYDDLLIFSDLFSIYLGIVNHYAKFEKQLKDAFDTKLFINYNFTDYLSKSLIKNKINCSNILYLNGQAENFNGIAKRKIVFGIDSKTLLQNSKFEIFTKRILRTINYTDVAKLNYHIGNSFEEICIIGHSLSIADYDSLHYIFLKSEDKTKPNIKIYYLNEKSKIELIMNLKIILGNEKFDEYLMENKLLFINSKEAWL